jgi:hypothetical protein
VLAPPEQPTAPAAATEPSTPEPVEQPPPEAPIGPDDEIYKALRNYSQQYVMQGRRYTLSDQIVRNPGVAVPITPAGVETTFGELSLALGRLEMAGSASTVR